ncbi:hypothetical protein V8E52_006096 [Russula decolorans]
MHLCKFRFMLAWRLAPLVGFSSAECGFPQSALSLLECLVARQQQFVKPRLQSTLHKSCTLLCFRCIRLGPVARQQRFVELRLQFVYL